MVFFFCRIPVVLENRSSSQGGGGRTPCLLPLDPRLSLAPGSLVGEKGFHHFPSSRDKYPFFPKQRACSQAVADRFDKSLFSPGVNSFKYLPQRTKNIHAKMFFLLTPKLNLKWSNFLYNFTT